MRKEASGEYLLEPVDPRDEDLGVVASGHHQGVLSWRLEDHEGAHVMRVGPFGLQMRPLLAACSSAAIIKGAFSVGQHSSHYTTIVLWIYLWIYSRLEAKVNSCDLKADTVG